MAAVNYQGKESEQSKARRDRKADVLAGEGSTAGKLKAGRQRKHDIQSRLQQELQPTRQTAPPQYGQTHMDAEGNQDTLE